MQIPLRPSDYFARVVSRATRFSLKPFASARTFVRVECISMCIRSIVIVLAFFVVCVCVAPGQPNKVEDTGIQGTVMVSPIRPGPIRKGSEFPTAAPLPNAMFRVMSDEKVVTKFTTDTEGRFRISLKPGYYSVRLDENRFPKPCGPFEIHVEAGKMTDVEWRCDSGMR